MPKGKGTGPPAGSSADDDSRKHLGINFSDGSGGKCVCPNCEKWVRHKRGIPCSSVECPDCGTAMTLKDDDFA